MSARTYTASPYRNIISNYDEAYTAIYEAVSDGKPSVDLTELKINTSDILKIFSDVIQSCPEFFYLDKQIKYYYMDRGIVHYVTTVEFQYTMAEDERKNAVAEYENELNYIVSMIDSGLSDAEKALWVHDYFVSSFEYDTEEGIYDAYNFFCERKGVCQAYSLAYMAVLREVGIESFMITSTEMNHAWNLVCIDGQWYHADLAFDDPSPDRIGRVLHENFLLTDEEIANTSNRHYGWTSKFTCDSEKFSDGFWKNVTSRMVCSGKD
ncbi:MAG: transglutaminase domain-containing protein, partial [Eubacteriales bacterium]